MTAQALDRPVPTNPIARLAGMIPYNAAMVVSILARLTGAAAAVYYAYDQDVLFPDRHFPRTWLIALVIAVTALISLVPFARLGLKPGLAAWLGALGCGLLVFGGAMLSHKAPGLVVVAAGVIAWVSYAAVSYQRGDGPGPSVSGLMSGSLLAYITVGIAVFLVGA